MKQKEEICANKQEKQLKIVDAIKTHTHTHTCMLSMFTWVREICKETTDWWSGYFYHLIMKCSQLR